MSNLCFGTDGDFAWSGKPQDLHRRCLAWNAKAAGAKMEWVWQKAAEQGGLGKV